MNTERDKKIAEALGLCWHEGEKVDFMGADMPGVSARCSKCKIDLDMDSYRIYTRNPSFSTFDGMGLILQEGPEVLGERVWGNFIWKMRGQVWAWGKSPLEYFIPQSLLQDPNKLANKLYAFLKET